MVEREFRNLSRLCEWGLSRAYPVAFGEERRWGWLWRSFLITAGIPEPTGLTLLSVINCLSCQLPKSTALHAIY